MEIVVVGAGIGGLTAALSLHAAGFERVRVLEAASEIRSIGVGLNILPNAVRELTELGVADQLARRAVATAELALYHRCGSLVWREPRGIDAGYRWPQLSVHRGHLQSTLLDAVVTRLGAGAVRAGARVVGVTGESRGRVGVDVEHRAGPASHLVADLVIAADGLHSAVRAQLVPGEGEPCTNGLVMWRGTTWAPPYLTGRSMVVIGDDRHRLVMYPIVAPAAPGDPTLINWVTALPVEKLAHPTMAPTTADRDEVLGHLRDWSFPGIDIAGLVTGADEILQYPMQDREPLPGWVFGRVVLLGDAAHPMHPAGSNGATQAIVDARVLAHHLATRGVDEALATYDAERRPAMAAIQRSNRTMGPERVINLAHERAPGGFDDVGDIIPPEELARVSATYAEAGGFSPEHLNARPSLNARRIPAPDPAAGGLSSPPADHDLGRSPSMTPSTSPRLEPIAVVGMGCRLPGASSPGELWEVLVNGRDLTREVPPDRYDIDALWSAEPEPGKVITRAAGFVDGVRLFDADFFGIDAESAAWLDPQQRLLLMVVWEALEDAGIPPERIAGSRSGVYVGYNRLDCKEEQMRRGLVNMSPRIILNVGSLLAGRVAFEYDLRGPAIALDTACSSSLVGIHLACQSMRAGETSMAIIGGVNLKLVAHEDVAMAQLALTARDGRCKFGDARADGWVPSDGVGAVVLKPLARALADGDRVRALIVGSAVANDGSTSGMPLRPSIEGQRQALRWAYEGTGIEPRDVDWIEAHGTGTPLIDPIELQAFGEVFGEGRPADRPLPVASVKTNIGHSEAASGLPGLMKTVLCLEHRQLPANLHFETPNPAIPWDELPITIPTELQALPDRGRPLVAGLFGQGLSAVNAHLVIREADAPVAARSPAEAGRRHLLVLSARAPEALADLARAYLAWLEPPGDGQKHELRDICHSAAAHRQHHPHRAALIVDSHASLTAALRRVLDGEQGLPAADPGDVDPLTRLAARYLAGDTVSDWGDALEAGARFVPLPTYPWQLRPYWWDTEASPEDA